MLSALIRQFPQKEFLLEELPDPTPGPTEVLVFVEASGLCATDLHLLEGRWPHIGLPRVPGHELAGTIIEVGQKVTNWHVGERVITAIDVPCGSCVFCIEGRTNLCPNFTRIGFERNGSHSQLAVVPAGNLVRLPEEIPFVEAAIIPDAVACSYHCIVTRGQVGAGQKVVILGAGGLGMHGIQICRLQGAQVLATSRQSRRREMARELGAEVVDPDSGDLREAVQAFSSGQGVDVVIDNVGLEDTIDLAIDLLRPGGKVVVVGYIVEEFKARYVPLMVREKEILGARGSVKPELEQVVRLVHQGKISCIIDRTYPLSKINQAAKAISDGEPIGRVVLLPQAS